MTTPEETSLCQEPMENLTLFVQDIRLNSTLINLKVRLFDLNCKLLIRKSSTVYKEI